MSELPSGAQHRIAAGAHAATVVEVGGGLRSYEVGGVPVLDGYRADERCTGGRGQLLLPWPNRLDGGRYRFGGVDHQLALSEPERRNAIHGLVRWMNWRAAVEEGDRVVMELVLHPQPGYPFTLGLSVEYRLDGRGLTVATTAVNLGREPCPYGAGAHPYLTVGTARVDDAVLEAPGTSRLETDDRGIPVGSVPVQGTVYDFRPARRVGDAVIDAAYTDLGGGQVRLSDPLTGRRVRLWMDDTHRWLMIFTGDTLAPNRRRRGLAVEPMTCPPNAYVSGHGLRVLEPGEAWTTTWGVGPG